ncbi:MAG: DUF3572 family protein [Hyphomicrobiaceae bacterium]|nr:DUF3572 family protein [Hyphomicrobiaceae bacterium]
MNQPSDIKVEYAELAFAHLLAEPEELARFMQASGYTPETLRRAIDSPELGTALIDYFAQNEALLLALCANAAIDPAHFMRVWSRDQIHDA